MRHTAEGDLNNQSVAEKLESLDHAATQALSLIGAPEIPSETSPAIQDASQILPQESFQGDPQGNQEYSLGEGDPQGKVVAQEIKQKGDKLEISQVNSMLSFLGEIFKKHGTPFTSKSLSGFYDEWLNK